MATVDYIFRDNALVGHFIVRLSTVFSGFVQTLEAPGKSLNFKT